MLTKKSPLPQAPKNPFTQKKRFLPVSWMRHGSGRGSRHARFLFLRRHLAQFEVVFSLNFRARLRRHERTTRALLLSGRTGRAAGFGVEPVAKSAGEAGAGGGGLAEEWSAGGHAAADDADSYLDETGGGEMFSGRL